MNESNSDVHINGRWFIENYPFYAYQLIKFFKKGGPNDNLSNKSIYC